MFSPSQDYVLVKPVPRKYSDIIEVVGTKPDQGTLGELAEVIAVGPGCPNKAGKLQPLALSPGDKVLYGGDGLGGIAFPTYEEAGVDYKIIQEADVVGILET
jgi:co-chaperonin GroES (HSP10)